MILAELLNISINLLMVLHVVVSLLLILVVLMQRPKQEGLGAAFGAGVADQVWGAQTTNVLQKGTVYLGVLFMLLSLVLAILIGNQNHQAAMSAPEPPAVEAAPAGTPEGGSVSEELEKAEADAAGTGKEEAPAEGETAPAEGETAPAEGEAAPAEGETAPVEGETAPVEGEAAPVEGETAPAEGETAPAEGETAPAVEGEEDKPQ